MGATADRHADRVVLTSDNPRSEAPCFILSQILAGVPGRDEVAVIEDRREAIAHAIARAGANDGRDKGVEGEDRRSREARKHDNRLAVRDREAQRLAGLQI